MTTRAWSYPIEHTTDANFRAWVTDFSTKLGEVGLAQTTDTGQIDIATATRPGTINTAAGYQIWRFPGQAVFMKIEYGSAAAAQFPGVWLTVGTNSNGAGTLTGVVSSRRLCSASSGSNQISSPGTLRQSYMCFSATSGFFGVSAYVGSVGGEASAFGFFVCRTVDVLGVLDNQGISVYYRTAGIGNRPAVQALNTITNVAGAVDANGLFCIVPHNITNTVVGSDQQAFLHWTAMPRVYPVMQLVTVSSAEFLLSTTFSATTVGNTPRNYITLDGGSHGASNETNQTTTPLFRIAMLWE